MSFIRSSITGPPQQHLLRCYQSPVYTFGKSFDCSGVRPTLPVAIRCACRDPKDGPPVTSDSLAASDCRMLNRNQPVSVTCCGAKIFSLAPFLQMPTASEYGWKRTICLYGKRKLTPFSAPPKYTARVVIRKYP